MLVSMLMLDIDGLRQNTSAGFRSALAEMAARLGLNPSYLAACMKVETGGTFSPSIQNPASKATGLIQFMPDTARAYGTTVQQLARMSATQQLAYVERYFLPYRSRIRPDVPGDYYLAVFWPALIGAPADRVIASAGDVVYAQNAGLDRNADGRITVGDVTATVDGVVARAMAKPPIEVTVGASTFAWAFGTMVAGLVGYALYERRRDITRYVEKHASFV